MGTSVKRNKQGIHVQELMNISALAHYAPVLELSKMLVFKCSLSLCRYIYFLYYKFVTSDVVGRIGLKKERSLQKK